MKPKMIKKVLRWTRDRWLNIRLTPKILYKWHKDSKSLPLTQDVWKIYWNIHISAFKEMASLPNLRHPKTLNDFIDWSKLFAQTCTMVQCSDKVKVRDYISEKVGSKYLCELYQVHASTKDIDFSALPEAYVIKTNHDSGSVILVSKNRHRPTSQELDQIEQSLKRPYGWENGEWPYSYVQPKVLVEEFIDDPDHDTPPDYKFQCLNGSVTFVRYTYDRQKYESRKEIVLDRDGKRLDYIVDHTFNKTDDPWHSPKYWHEMIKLSEKLSSDFFMARVDFYCSDERLLIGEITFFPQGGHNISTGQERVIDDFNMSLQPPLPPVIAQLENKMSRQRIFKKRTIYEKLTNF